jgi:hypothetical protein
MSETAEGPAMGAGPEPTRAAREPIEYLKELYVVVAALALSKALESLLPQAGETFDPSLLIPLLSLLVTLVPFFHGALEYLQRTHGLDARVHARRDERRDIALVLWDFGLLFVEACVLLFAATSMKDLPQLAYALAALWALDILWISVGKGLGSDRRAQRDPPPQTDGVEASGPPWKWAVLNAVAAPTAVAIAKGLEESESALAWALLATALTRTVLDYALTPEYYFGELGERLQFRRMQRKAGVDSDHGG